MILHEQTELHMQGKKTQDTKTKVKKKKKNGAELRWRHSGGDETESGSDNEDGEAAWKVAEAASCFLNRWRFSIGTTYLALAIVPPRPLVTQTNKTARTYHRGAVSDLGLDTAVFFKLYEVVERIPRPCAEEEERIKKHGMRKL